MLNFGAVDQICEISVNGRPCGRHEGGYLPFSVDITSYILPGSNDLEVLATDELSTDFPYGKQSKDPHGMWYTQCSGIWQTVWLEAVPEAGAVRSLRITPDLQGVSIEVDTDAASFTVTVPEAGISVTSREKTVRIDVPSPRLWSPEEPHLYDFTVETATDRVESCFALRTVTTDDIDGHRRLLLNGKSVFLHALLDQGYFHDGLFLPREPEEYDRDIKRAKSLGFNALRKHVKIEPEAYYHACDSLGILVLQDMVSSGEYSFVRDTLLPTVGFKRKSDKKAPVSQRRRELFVSQALGSVRMLYNHPSIVGWTIFNEGWGQFDCDEIYELLKSHDPTRFILPASGWFEQSKGDARGEHVYFRSKVLRPTNNGKLLLLSECGGFSRRVEGHVSADLKNYGYGAKQDSEAALTAKIRAMYDKMVLPSIKNGLSGCVYTQLYDVEGETNGLYTYDREVCKVERGAMLKLASDIMSAAGVS